MHHVLDPDHRHAGSLDPLQLADQGRRLVVRQAAGDLVEQQQLGPGGERAGELEALAVEKREPAGPLVGVRAQAGLLEHRGAVCQASCSDSRPPKQAAVTRFSNTVMWPNGCGTW